LGGVLRATDLSYSRPLARHEAGLGGRDPVRLPHEIEGPGLDLVLDPRASSDRRRSRLFQSMRETNHYVRGMFSWIGFKQVGVPFRGEERFAGQTKYPLTKMLKFATDGIVSFSSEPLRLALKLGFLVSGLSFLLGVVFLVSKIAGLYEASLASIAVFVAFLGGNQLLLLGIMGEYIGICSLLMGSGAPPY
jgi:hypothetical protein